MTNVANTSEVACQLLRLRRMIQAELNATRSSRTSVLAGGVAIATRTDRAWKEESGDFVAAKGGSARLENGRPIDESSTMDVWLTPGRFAPALAMLVFLAFPFVTLGLRTFVFRDFGLFSYPVAHFARESFWRGELPLWNPLNHCGVPFLAQWNTMVLYPPTVLYLLLPLDWSLSFFCLLHLVWGGVGMYFLARRWTGLRLPAALAGILFALNGLNLSFLMWPSHVATFSWLPWVLWLGNEGLRLGGRKLLWAVGAAALQMLAGGPETIVVTWLLLGLLAGNDIFWRIRKPAGVQIQSVPPESAKRIPLSMDLESAPQKKFPSPLPSPKGKGRGLLRFLKYQTTLVSPAGARFMERSRIPRQIIFRFLGMAFLVGMLCAAQLLPFLELLKNSQRDSGYGAAAHDWAMPIWGWANFLVPLFRTNPTSQGVFLQNGQYWTSSYYVGIGTIWLAAIGVWRTRDRRVHLLALACFFALILAWGDTSWLFHTLRTWFPGLGLMRYPVKFVILAVAVLPLLAAYGLAGMITERRQLSRFEWGSAFALLLLVGIIVAVERSAPTDVFQFTWHNAVSRAGMLVLEVLLVAMLLRQLRSKDDSSSAGGHEHFLTRIYHRLSACEPPISLTPRFSGVDVLGSCAGTVSTVSRAVRKLLKQFACFGRLHTPLNRGVDETRWASGLALVLLLAFYLDLLTHVPNQNPTVSPTLYATGLASKQFGEGAAPTLGHSRAMVSPAARERLKGSWLAHPAQNLTRNRLAGWSDVNLLEGTPQVDGFFSLVPRAAFRATELPYAHPQKDFSSLLDFMGVTQISQGDNVCAWSKRSTALPLVSIGQKPRFADARSSFEALEQTNLDLSRIVLLPPAALADGDAQADPAATTGAVVFHNQEISFETDSTASTMVVIAQTYYPAWRAYVDGRSTRLWRANYAFQALQVPAGSHRITLEYVDHQFLAGVILSGLGLAWGFILWRRAAGRHSASQP